MHLFFFLHVKFNGRQEQESLTCEAHLLVKETRTGQILLQMAKVAFDGCFKGRAQ